MALLPTRVVLLVGHPSGLTFAAFHDREEKEVCLATLPRGATVAQGATFLEETHSPSPLGARRFYGKWRTGEGGEVLAWFQASPKPLAKGVRLVLAPIGGTEVKRQKDFYHMAINAEDLAALSVCPFASPVTAKPPELAWVMYHGTPLVNVESILREGLRPTERGMEGRGVYLGDFLKAVRFAMFSTYWTKFQNTSKRGAGAVLRCVAVGTRRAHKVLDVTGAKERPCLCLKCDRDERLKVSSKRKRLLVDHRGDWHHRQGFGTLWVPPCEWAPGKKIVGKPELVVADPLAVFVTCAREVNMATRRENYDPEQKDHRVLL